MSRREATGVSGSAGVAAAVAAESRVELDAEELDPTEHDAAEHDDETLGTGAWVSFALFGVLVAGVLGCSVLQPWNWFS